MAIDQFDPGHCWVSPAYSCFLKNSLCSHMALIIQFLIVSKSKPENASSGPLSLFAPPPCPWPSPPLLLQTQASIPTCEHSKSGLVRGIWCFSQQDEEKEGEGLE